MDDAAVLAPPAAIAALQSELLRRMRREGATLQVEKCVWTALAPDTRAQFPPDAKIGRAEVVRFDASGQPETILVGYGVDIDGIPVGDDEYKHARHTQIVDATGDVITAVERALLRGGSPDHVHRHAA